MRATSKSSWARPLTAFANPNMELDLFGLGWGLDFSHSNDGTWSEGSNKAKSRKSEVTTSFELGDDTLADFFDVRILSDPV